MTCKMVIRLTALVVIISNCYLVPIVSASSGDIREIFNILERYYLEPRYYYVHESKVFENKIEFNHVHRNPSNVTDSVDYSVSVTKSTSANVTVSITFDAMVAQAGVSPQVDRGVSKTGSISMGWKIPPNSGWRLTAGTRFVKVIGKEVYVYGAHAERSRPVKATWSYETWSDKMRL